MQLENWLQGAERRCRRLRSDLPSVSDCAWEPRCRKINFCVLCEVTMPIQWANLDPHMATQRAAGTAVELMKVSHFEKE